jgi:hypothetical protein
MIHGHKISTILFPGVKKLKGNSQHVINLGVMHVYGLKFFTLPLHLEDRGHSMALLSTN